MTVFLTTVIAMAAFVAAAVVFFLLGRVSVQRRTARLEARVMRAEQVGSREALERLQVMRRHLGVLYIDGLPATGNRKLERLFVSGLRSAGRIQWDRAAKDWQEALRFAEGSEAAALRFLCAGCYLIRGRYDQARGELEGCIELARHNSDRVGVASGRFALGILERDAGQPDAARVQFSACIGLWAELGEVREQARASVRLAGLLELAGDMDGALSLHRDVLRFCEQLGDDARMAGQYGTIGRMLLVRGDLDGARAAYEDGLHVAHKTGDRAIEAECLAAIGRIHLRQGSPKRAREVLERALKWFRDGNLEPAQAEVLVDLAHAYCGVGKRDVALECYEQALRLARKAGNKSRQAASLVGMALASREHGLYEKSLELLIEAVELDRDGEDRSSLGKHLVALAFTRLELHDTGRARVEFGEAQALVGDGGDEETGAWIQLGLARLLRSEAKFDEAAEHLSGLSVSGDTAVGALFHIETGLTHLARRDAASAIRELERAADIQRKLNDHRGFGRSLVDLGTALAATGELDKATRLVEDGVDRLHSAGTRSDEAWALRALAEVDRARGRMRSALQHLERSLEHVRSAGDHWGEAETLLVLGRLAVAERDAAKAKVSFDAARRSFVQFGAVRRIAEVDEELAQLPEAESGVKFLDSDTPDR